MAKPNAVSSKVQTTAEKWGPSEWFGQDVGAVTQSQRLTLAQKALLPQKQANQNCPYLSSLTSIQQKCSKPGGVCSVQRYSVGATKNISLTGHRVSICPMRLVSRDVLNAIAMKVLGIDKGVVLVKEVPYSVSLTKTKKGGAPAAAGRIDWLLVDEKNPTRFCAVETQSVYMSGKSQDATFQAFVNSGGAMAIPPDYRHPDYKSSVPKRLAPQLESKARHLSSTSRKTVVLVDEFVRENMSTLQEIPVPKAYEADPIKAEEHKLNGSEVIFAIVTLATGSLAIKEFLYCTVSAAKDALSAVSAMSHADFERVVTDLVQPPSKKKGKVASPRADKVFKIS